MEECSGKLGEQGASGGGGEEEEAGGANSFYRAADAILAPPTLLKPPSGRPPASHWLQVNEIFGLIEGSQHAPQLTPFNHTPHPRRPHSFAIRLDYITLLINIVLMTPTGPLCPVRTWKDG